MKRSETVNTNQATYALIGNPNVGKTSLFNLLTCSRYEVGNWAGVTVEKKEGLIRGKRMRRHFRHRGYGQGHQCQHGDRYCDRCHQTIENHRLIDLPGIYSLSPVSEDEHVAVNFIFNDQVDKTINIVDASSLDRNLYLTLQMLEMNKPLVMALNMIDVAKSYGFSLDTNKMSERLGIPVVPMVTRVGQGLDKLYDALVEPAVNPDFKISYNPVIEEGIASLSQLFNGNLAESEYRWVALQIIEGNQELKDRYIKQESMAEAYQVLLQMSDKCKAPLADVIRDERYQYIESFLTDVKIIEEADRINWTERIDQIVTNRWLGIPIFFLAIFLTFQITFTWVGTPLQDLLEDWFRGPLSAWVINGMVALDLQDWLIALVVDGILAGVGGVLVFIPQIFLLFIIISFLEDSGYMARAAFLMDRGLSKLGLNGKAFIPLVVGFGCNVPGIMSARTLENSRERLVTILLNPFMSCTARIMVYALFTSIFFKSHQGLVIFSLYFLGIVVAILLGLVFKRFLLKGETGFFVMEMPPYRIPIIKNIALSTWDKGKEFLKKAGTIILAMSVVLWFLSSFSFSGMVEMGDSFLAALGAMLAPFLAPLGFGTWEAGVSLISGFVAKEVVVSTMSIVYGAGDITTQLSATIQDVFNPVSAYAFMVFILLYAPCMPTLVVMRKEIGSWKWPLFSIVYSVGIAWILAFIVYQVGSLLLL